MRLHELPLSEDVHNRMGIHATPKRAAPLDPKTRRGGKETE